MAVNLMCGECYWRRLDRRYLDRNILADHRALGMQQRKHHVPAYDYRQRVFPSYFFASSTIFAFFFSFTIVASFASFASSASFALFAFFSFFRCAFSIRLIRASL